MRGGRNAILVHFHAPDLRNLLGTLRRRQHAAMSGLGALADLELHHLDLIVGRNAGELIRIESTVAVAAAEIAGADFPNEIAAPLTVVRTDTAFAGVMRKAALL